MNDAPLLINRKFPVAITTRDGKTGHVNGHVELGDGEMFLAGYVAGVFEMWLPTGRWGYSGDHPLDIASHG